MGRVVGEPKLEKFRKDRSNSNSRYYIYWTDDVEGSKELSTRTTDYSKANAVYNKWRLRHLGTPAPKAIFEVRVDEVLSYYRENRIIAKKDLVRTDFAILRLSDFWQDRPVSVVNWQTLHDYETFRFEQHEKLFPNREPLSENTIRRELVVLRAALHRAYRGKLIDQEVFIDLQSEAISEAPYFSCREAIGLIYFAKKLPRAKHYLPIFLSIGFLTGRRKAAILELRWKDIDFNSGFIRWQRDGVAETNKRRPTGALPKRLKRILLKHRALFPDDKYVVSFNGKQICDIKKSFSDAVRVLHMKLEKSRGSESSQPLLKAYPHMMRHSCATWLMQKGADKRESCEFLGMTEDTLERRYWHHHPDFQRGPANMF